MQFLLILQIFRKRHVVELFAASEARPPRALACCAAQVRHALISITHTHCRAAVRNTTGMQSIFRNVPFRVALCRRGQAQHCVCVCASVCVCVCTSVSLCLLPISPSPSLQSGSVCILKQVNPWQCCDYAAQANGVIVAKTTSSSNTRCWALTPASSKTQPTQI